MAPVMDVYTRAMSIQSSDTWPSDEQVEKIAREQKVGLRIK